MNKKILLAAGAVFVILVLVLSFTARKGKNYFAGQGSGGPSAQALLNEAKTLQAKGDLPALKKIYQKLVNDFPNSREVMSWQKKIDDTNIKLLFSSALTPKSALYVIKPGDTLTKIAREFRTTPELIKKSNGLSDDKIIPGRKIKVWKAPFSIVVDKSQNILLLKSDEEIMKTYIVSTGKNNSTPVGNFKITSKLINPTWFKAGAVIPSGSPENILGTRWLGLDRPSYGIHGTTEPQSLGRQATQGCVRMTNQDVEELYIIVPIGTEVIIVD
ncbi:MAG: L,D-transpeptidase family protein [Candidatus Omnitrophica bacterium]|nr:L,D-transpeptidase family protein [Candidatus Omnitrophota bacterium]MDD5027230.1 L,D-transpeptidase family protein [Candidatus Omnitrophota bacterium]MDD5661633.1 L,D-transpeptidase family protein [Candidatus Omnitrophota bacterium]